MSTPAGSGVKLSKRKGMTVYKYTQVRKYTHIPADFLLQMRSWFYQQKFKIKKNTRGHGHLAGRKDGIHVNFVPKFLVSVKNYADHADHAEVTFSYAARIRKIGIATAVLTEGLSLIVGAVTLTSHIASARGFVDAVTDVMDAISGAPFEVRWLEATEAPGSETATTTTTVTRSAPAITPAPVVTPVSPPPLPPRIKTPQAPVPNLMDAPVVEPAPQPQQQQQPQIIVVPQSTIVIQAPMGYPYGLGGYHQALPYQQQGAYDSLPASNPFASATSANNALPQIAYQSSTSQLPIGEPTVPVMMERPAPLTSTRYPMPFESSNNTPFSSAPVPSSSYSSAPLAQAAPSQKPLAIEYPTLQRTSSASSLTGAKMPEISANTFSLNEPMFPQYKQQMAAPVQPNPFAAYGSARN